MSTLPRYLVPFVHVADMPCSLAFYQQLGFKVNNTFEHDGETKWAWLDNERASIMLACASEPIDPNAQAVMFYIYVDDVSATHAAFTAKGINVSAITYPFYARYGEFRVVDPDGYALMFTHTGD